MGYGLSVPVDDTPKLPSGKPARRACLTCNKPIPCEHHPAHATDSVSAGPTALKASKTAKDGGSDLCVPVAPDPPHTPPSMPPAVRPSGGGALAPYEHEDVAELRRKLQVPQLIENTVTFCKSLLDCYRIADADETKFTEEFARLKKRADYLTSRHKCIEENKGKGVLVPDFVNAHLKEVAEWVADCERFGNSFYKAPVAHALE
jgi:hypothetical protein